jgi:hypothetical protein
MLYSNLACSYLAVRLGHSDLHLHYWSARTGVVHVLHVHDYGCGRLHVRGDLLHGHDFANRHANDGAISHLRKADASRGVSPIAKVATSSFATMARVIVGTWPALN